MLLALFHMKKQGYSHRDIKPSNILKLIENWYKLSDLDNIKDVSQLATVT